MAEPGRLPIDLIPPLHCAIQPPDDATVKAKETQTQLPERHSSGTQQPRQNIKSNLKSHAKKKKKNRIKLWFFPLTFSYQNPQSHYVYGSLCSSFFLQQSFD